MGSDSLVEQSRNVYSTAGLDWQSRFHPTVLSRLSLIVNSFLFQLKKTNIKWKRSLALFAKKKFVTSVEEQRKRMERNLESREYSLLLELGVQLSSIIPASGLFPSLCSAPGRRRHDCQKRLLDLDDDSILKIARFMDSRSVLCFAQVSRRLRAIILANIGSLEKVKSVTYDMYIDFNKHTGLEDVRALKYGRSVGDVSYTAISIENLIPSMLCCQLRIHFGNNVFVLNWLPEIYSLYKENRLCPLSFIFGGGSFSDAVDGYRFTGAELRCFSESDFIAIVGLFAPTLKEVQLASSRLFKVSTSPDFLFSMINLVSVFGMTYEPQPVYYNVEDICRIICLWRCSSRSHSCEVYICRPLGCDKVNWLQYGTVVTTHGYRVEVVRVKHSVFERVMLILNFH